MPGGHPEEAVKVSCVHCWATPEMERLRRPPAQVVVRCRPLSHTEQQQAEPSRLVADTARQEVQVSSLGTVAS